MRINLSPYKRKRLPSHTSGPPPAEAGGSHAKVEERRSVELVVVLVKVRRPRRLCPWHERTDW